MSAYRGFECPYIAVRWTYGRGESGKPVLNSFGGGRRYKLAISFAMFRLLFYFLTAVVLQAIYEPAHAGLEGSPHDFSTGTDEYGLAACEYCHTRHSDGAIVVPMWERTTGELRTFNVYNPVEEQDSTSGPGVNSLICVGCHDAVTGRSIRVWKRDEDKGFPWDDERIPWNSICFNTSRTMNGRDVGNEHPVGFVFVDSSRNFVKHGVPDHVFMPEFGSDSTGYGFKLYGSRGTFECTTCHDVHDNDRGYFLRAPKGTICTDCHQKK